GPGVSSSRSTKAHLRNARRFLRQTDLSFRRDAERRQADLRQARRRQARRQTTLRTERGMVRGRARGTAQDSQIRWLPEVQSLWSSRAELGVGLQAQGKRPRGSQVVAAR